MISLNSITQDYGGGKPVGSVWFGWFWFDIGWFVWTAGATWSDRFLNSSSFFIWIVAHKWQTI